MRSVRNFLLKQVSQQHDLIVSFSRFNPSTWPSFRRYRSVYLKPTDEKCEPRSTHRSGQRRAGRQKTEDREWYFWGWDWGHSIAGRFENTQGSTVLHAGCIFRDSAEEKVDAGAHGREQVSASSEPDVQGGGIWYSAG